MTFTPTTITSESSLLEFPCTFPIKVMGGNRDDFVPSMKSIALSFDPNFDASSLELRESLGSKYLGITLHVYVTSRAQLDELYRTLSSHPLVKVVL